MHSNKNILILVFYHLLIMGNNGVLLLHSVMQFKYFSEALLARLGADFPSQYQLEIVHYTSLGAGKELESFPLQTPGYWI